MSNIKNFIDERTARKVIDALCALDFKTIHKLAEDSGVPVSRLQNFIEGTEKITQLDKGKLIIYLVKLVDIIEEEGQLEETKKQIFTSLKDFQQHKTG